MVWRKKQQHCYSAWTSEPGCFTRSWGVFTKSIQLSLLFTLYSWLITEVSCWYNADPSKVENKTLSFVVNSNPEYVPVIRKFEHSQSISCFSTSWQARIYLLYGSILQFILCWYYTFGDDRQQSRMRSNLWGCRLKDKTWGTLFCLKSGDHISGAYFPRQQ